MHSMSIERSRTLRISAIAVSGDTNSAVIGTAAVGVIEVFKYYAELEDAGRYEPSQSRVVIAF